MALVGLLDRVGLGFANLLSNPGTGLYAIYVIVFFMGLFVLYRQLLNTVPHLKGKPASVLSFMISIISVGGILYNKTALEVILLFKGFTGFLLALMLGVVILVGSIAWAKKFEKTNIKTMIISWGIYITTSIIVPVYSEFFNIVSDLNAKGAAQIIGDLLQTISDISFIVALISLVLFLGGLLKFGSENSFGASETTKNREEFQRILKRMNESMGKVNVGFKNKGNLLNQLIRQPREGSSSNDEIINSPSSGSGGE